MKALTPRALALLAAVLFWASAAPAAMRPEVARLLPPDAVTVAGADLQALRGSPLFERFLSKLPDPGQWNAGLDLKEDLDRVYLASMQTPSAFDVWDALIVFEGRFARAQEALQALPAGSEHAGFRLRQARFAGNQPPDWTFAFLDAQTAIAGPAAQVVAAIDRRQAVVDPAQPFFAAIAQESSHLWAVTFDAQAALGPWIDSVPGGGGPLRAIAAAMHSLTVRANAVPEGLQAEMAFQCGGPDDARSLADAARAIAAFGALTTQSSRPALADLLGKLQIRQAASEAALSVTLTDQHLHF